VCRSVSCALRGGEEILDHICHTAGIDPYGTTADGSLTVEPAECLGACDFAPCMLAGKTLHKNLTKESAEAFVRDARARAGASS
jgi:NADH-quinone oxidoreductase subunit E